VDPMERSQGYYRHQRKRAIQNKLEVMKQVWGYTEHHNHSWVKQPGHLDKARLNCSCAMCKYEKHYSIPKANNKAKWDGMKEEINDFMRGSW
jgi:cytochrome c5